MKKMFKKFKEEKDGVVMEFIIMLAVIGVIAAVILPNLATNLSCMSHDTTAHAGTGKGGAVVYSAPQACSGTGGTTSVVIDAGGTGGVTP